jgi:signal transduction histidine kinase
MKLRIQIFFIAALMIMSPLAYSHSDDVVRDLSVNDVFAEKLKSDSLLIVSVLDSANHAFVNFRYGQAIHFAEKSQQLSKKYPHEDYQIQSMLLLARSYRSIHQVSQTEAAFNNTLKYYLKAITFLESVNSKVLLPRIYMEYGDFYASVNLPKLTVRNYEKALEIFENSNKVELQKGLLKTIGDLHYDLGNLETSIQFNERLAAMYKNSRQETAYIQTLQQLCELYRKVKAYDNSLYYAKELLTYFKEQNDIAQQIAWLKTIGDISYEAGNHYQAKSYFIEYFELIKKCSDCFETERRSLRYTNTLIKVGEIYKWSTDNGYLSNYELAIRHFNAAQKYTDFREHPDLASIIMSQTGKIYFKRQEFKTCITYFDLALFYAKKTGNLDAISEIHLLLARAYDVLEKWKEASANYELHAACTDSIIHQKEALRLLEQETVLNQRLDNLKVEEILDRIEALERQELTLAEKELRNVTLERELEIYRRDVELKEALLHNQQLAEDSAKRDFQLAMQHLENESNRQKIAQLKSEKEKQDLIMKNQEADQQNKKQRIKILEQQNALAYSRQVYYVLFIMLISIILVFTLVIYIQKRKANKVLKNQNEKIALQAVKIEEAYKNLELLSNIGRDITSSLIVEEIIETVYANLNTLMDAAVFGIGVYDQQKNVLHFPGVIENNERLNNISIPLDDEETLAAVCFLNQKEIVVSDFHQEYGRHITPRTVPAAGDGNSSSIIYLPLTHGNKKLGVLTVQSFSINAYHDHHINIVRNIAIYTRIALENARVFIEMEKQSMNLLRANKNIKQQHELIEEQYQQLLTINDEKNNLIKILAHDLRNPLSTAMSMTELVRFEKKNLSAEQYQASEIIWRGLKRMDEMIRKILDIKAIESQKVLLDFDLVNVNDILPAIEDAFANEAMHKLIKLHLSAAEREHFIRVDRNYLNQIVENLVSNAIKFSPPHKNVYVTISDHDDHVRISVDDEGPGIRKDEMPLLFKKYQRLSAKPTAGEQSIGLGLSIVKKYVEVMDGKVWCDSTIGKGSRFVVEFKKVAVPVV